MHSDNHRYIPLHTVTTLLLPAIKRQQFILIMQNNKPVAFVSWAWLDDEAEAQYLAQGSMLELAGSAWNSGQNMWLIDWIAPFGHTSKMARLILDQLLADFCFCSLYHKRQPRKIKMFKGKNISKIQAQQWLMARSLSNK